MLRQIRRTIHEFVGGESGRARPQVGLPMAWTVGIMMMMAVLIGGAGRAEAAQCWLTIDCEFVEFICEYECQSRNYGSGSCDEFSQGLWWCHCADCS